MPPKTLRLYSTTARIASCTLSPISIHRQCCLNLHIHRAACLSPRTSHWVVGLALEHAVIDVHAAGARCVQSDVYGCDVRVLVVVVVMVR